MHLNPYPSRGAVYTFHFHRRTEVMTLFMESLKRGSLLKFIIKRNLKIKKDAARAHHFLKYEGPEPSNFFTSPYAGHLWPLVYQYHIKLKLYHIQVWHMLQICAELFLHASLLLHWRQWHAYQSEHLPLLVFFKTGWKNTSYWQQACFQCRGNQESQECFLLWCWLIEICFLWLLERPRELVISLMVLAG